MVAAREYAHRDEGIERSARIVEPGLFVCLGRPSKKREAAATAQPQ